MVQEMVDQEDHLDEASWGRNGKGNGNLAGGREKYSIDEETSRLG
jgi:hypothetical protein